MTKPIYGIAVNAPTQKLAVEKHCFGDCGKITFMFLDDPSTGGLGVCRQETCPHMQKEFPDYGTTGSGEALTLRVLNEEPK